MKRNPLIRGLAATLAAATLLSVTAAPAAFATTSGAVSQPATGARTPLPPLNPAALQAAHRRAAERRRDRRAVAGPRLGGGLDRDLRDG
ncbi:MAG TPA: hypothetical protein VGH57_23615 [Amycolatopsis sp.]